MLLLLQPGFWIIQPVSLGCLEFTEQKVEVVAYLQPTPTTRRSARARRSRARPTLAWVEIVTRDKALRASFPPMMEAPGPHDLTHSSNSNPLYASIEVNSRMRRPLRAVGQAMTRVEHPIVRNVIDIEDLVDRVLTVTNILRTTGTACC